MALLIPIAACSQKSAFQLSTTEVTIRTVAPNKQVCVIQPCLGIAFSYPQSELSLELWRSKLSIPPSPPPTDFSKQTY